MVIGRAVIMHILKMIEETAALLIHADKYNETNIAMFIVKALNSNFGHPTL